MIWYKVVFKDRVEHRTAWNSKQFVDDCLELENKGALIQQYIPTREQVMKLYVEKKKSHIGESNDITH